MQNAREQMTQGADVTRWFGSLDDKLSLDEYNFEHFRAKHLLSDARATIEERGIRPGATAPDFELPRVGGGKLRLSELRGRPALLHFGSPSCPVTTGSFEPLSKLHALRGAEVDFVDVVIRQAHPGPGAPTYHSFEEKMRDAEAYQQEFRIEWPVLVDDLAGTTHQVYGGLADPTYLIDRDGRVAFYVMWTHAPTLYRAIEQLMRQGGRGVVNGGVDRTPHILPAMTDGWNGLRRGLPQSLIDMESAAPTTGVGAWLGHQLRPLLAPLTLRAEPLPPAAKAGLALGAVALVVLGARAFRRDSRRNDWKRSFSRLWG